MSDEADTPIVESEDEITEVQTTVYRYRGEAYGTRPQAELARARRRLDEFVELTFLTHSNDACDIKDALLKYHSELARILGAISDATARVSADS